MTQPSEPCLGPHTCPGCRTSIIALEFSCPGCWQALPRAKHLVIRAAWDHLPSMVADGYWSARQWLRADCGVDRPAEAPAGEVGQECHHRCPGRCGSRITCRTVACQTDWLQLPPDKRIAVWSAWDEGPDQINTALREIRWWFRNNPPRHLTDC